MYFLFRHSLLFYFARPPHKTRTVERFFFNVYPHKCMHYPPKFRIVGSMALPNCSLVLVTEETPNSCMWQKLTKQWKYFISLCVPLRTKFLTFTSTKLCCMYAILKLNPISYILRCYSTRTKHKRTKTFFYYFRLVRRFKFKGREN